MRNELAILLMVTLPLGCASIQSASKQQIRRGETPSASTINITVRLHNQPTRRITIQEQNATLRQAIAKYQDELGALSRLESEILGDSKRVEALIGRKLEDEERLQLISMHSSRNAAPYSDVLILSTGTNRIFIHEEVVVGTTLGNLQLQDGAEVISIPIQLLKDNIAGLWALTPAQPTSPTVTFNFPGMGLSKTAVWDKDATLDQNLATVYVPAKTKFSRDFPPTIMTIARRNQDSLDLLILPLGSKFCEDFFSDPINESVKVRIPSLQESTSTYLVGPLDGDTISVLRPEDIPL